MTKYPYGLTLQAACDAIDAYRDQEDVLPEAGMIAAFEILLAAMDKASAALTEQPVKQPGTKCIGWVKESIQEHDAKWRNAIRAAGYEVQE